MTIQRIPTPQGLPAFSLRVVLERVAYRLQFAWNQRDERWYVQLRTDAGDLIAARKVAPNWPMLRGLRHPARPPGDLVALDHAESGAAIGLNDWGQRVVLAYLEAADVAELIAAAEG
jgi:hypothetical protein